MNELLFFGVCFGSGIISAPIYFAFGYLRKTGGVLGSAIADIAFALLFFSALLLAAFFLNDGVITAYAAVSQAAAFLATCAAIRKAAGFIGKKAGD